MTKTPVLAAALAAALAAPASAAAAPALSVQGSCFGATPPKGASFATAPLTGTGFTPGASVSFGGDVTGFVVADERGAFQHALRLPFYDRATPRTLEVTATEDQNAAQTAATSFPIVADVFTVEANLNGNPRSRITWRFAGFRTGETIYGHFRHPKSKRNYRFGVAKGDCGTLTVRARRLPVPRILNGLWRLRFDHSPVFSAKEPGRTGSIRIIGAR
jgi:hypothetical protein